MKKTQTILIPTYSEDWYKFRSAGTQDHIGGTGASEIGLLMGFSQYKNPMQFYHEKVGVLPYSHIDNERMLHGRLQEATIGLLWQFWAGTPESYMENFSRYNEIAKEVKEDDVFMFEVEDFKQIVEQRAKDYIVRKAKRHEGYIIHPDYPYLFASLDYKCDEGFSLITGEKIPPFPIECKTIGENVARHHKVYSLPDAYIIQLNQQMLLTDSYYGEIATLIGGNQFRVHSYERNDYICKQIIKINTEFWEQRILPGREAFAKYIETGNEEHLADVYSYEPEPDGNPSYSEYLSSRHDDNDEQVTIKGDKDTASLIRDAIDAKEYLKKITEYEKELKNKITYKFVQGQCDLMLFGDDGYAKYFKKAGNNNKELSLRGYKYSPSIEEVDRNFKNFLKTIK